jgi:hypothetical protein
VVPICWRPGRRLPREGMRENWSRRKKVRRSNEEHPFLVKVETARFETGWFKRRSNKFGESEDG